jgi:hypothetical protein
MTRRLADEIQIGPFSIAIFEQDDPIDADGSIGEWDATTRIITLQTGLRGKDRWVILLHELVHAISDIYDLDIDAEYVCTTIANSFVQGLAGYMKQPPEARPAVMDDEKTPTVPITPITRKEQMP